MSVSRRIFDSCVLILGLASFSSCRKDGTPINVESTVHSDGSCDRQTLQPRFRFAPEAGYDSPEWKSHWESVTWRKDPNGQDGIPAEHAYGQFMFARGNFKKPEDIPVHFLVNRDPKTNLKPSTLTRSYSRSDYGVFVEHVWIESVTNDVAWRQYVKSIDILNEFIRTDAYKSIYDSLATQFDVSGASSFLERDARNLLFEIANSIYDAGASGRWESSFADELTARAREVGIDLQGSVKEFLTSGRVSNWKPFRDAIANNYVRNRDGSPLNDEQRRTMINELHQRDLLPIGPFSREQIDTLSNAFNSVTGGFEYIPSIMDQSPTFHFKLRMPGRVFEANGILIADDQVSWSFSILELFPKGFEMKARSVELDLGRQEDMFGRVLISDFSTAIEVLQIIHRNPSVGEIMKKCRAEKSLAPLHGGQVDRSAKDQNDLDRVISLLKPKS